MSDINFDNGPKKTSGVTTDSILTGNKLPNAETRAAAETRLQFLDEILDREEGVVTQILSLIHI